MSTDGSRDEVRDERRGTRQESMGSNERAVEERRNVQRLVKLGEESIPDLVAYVGNFLQTPVKQAKKMEKAAMKAIAGLGQLCQVADSSQHRVSEGKQFTVEQLLLHALEKGNDRLQCAAAESLGLIGSWETRVPLERRSQEDKSATVRARSKIAVRRIMNRSGNPKDFDAIMDYVCGGAAELSFSKPKDNLYKVVCTLTGDEERTQTVYIKTGNKDSRVVGRENIHNEYIVLYTPCGPVNEAAFSKILSYNALRLSPDKLVKSPFGFTQGSIGTLGNEFIMIDTQFLEAVTQDSVSRGIRVLATIGDEIEKRLTGGGDSR